MSDNSVHLNVITPISGSDAPLLASTPPVTPPTTTAAPTPTAVQNHQRL